MADLPLKGLRVAILATDGVEKVALTLPRLSLEEAGADTVLISDRPQIASPTTYRFDREMKTLFAKTGSRAVKG